MTGRALSLQELKFFESLATRLPEDDAHAILSQAKVAVVIAENNGGISFWTSEECDPPSFESILIAYADADGGRVEFDLFFAKGSLAGIDRLRYDNVEITRLFPDGDYSIESTE